MNTRKHIDPNVNAIAEYLNSPESWDCDLNELLIEEIEWSDVDPETIIRKLSLRKFTKSIYNKEVRLDVMKFLDEYAYHYFEDGAYLLSGGIRSGMEWYIEEFQSELRTQISQIEKMGQFSGDKFSKLQKRNEQLEEQVRQLKSQNKDLSIQLDKYKHPSKYGKHIPEELIKLGIFNMLLYLESVKVVRSVTEPDSIGRHQITCFQWDASKALFGYFVGKVNDAVGIRGARVPYNWKIFKPIINNYDELIDEARKSLSAINNSSSKQAIRLEGVEKIDEALNHREFPF